MFKYACLNPIANVGLKNFDENYVKTDDVNEAEGILVKTGEGILAVKKLQRQGKNAMDYKSFMNGARNFIGTVLF